MTNKKVKPLFVIISGGSGSGKTTVSELIISNLPKGYKGTVISFDNFYLSKDVIKTDNYDSPEAIDWFAAREAIKFLVENNSAYDMPVYDFKKQKVTKTKKVNSADVIILEGILSLYNDDIKKLADIKIYVDVPDDERLIRRILRDEKARGTNVNGTIEKWRKTVIKMHQKYVEPTKYESDLIIPWGSDKTNMVPILAISGALEYMLYTRKKILEHAKSKAKK